MRVATWTVVGLLLGIVLVVNTDASAGRPRIDLAITAALGLAGLALAVVRERSARKPKEPAAGTGPAGKPPDERAKDPRAEPARLRHPALPRRWRGYDRESTDRLLAETATAFEALIEEHEQLAQQVEQLEAELAQFREADRAPGKPPLATRHIAEQVGRVRRSEAEHRLRRAWSRTETMSARLSARLHETIERSRHGRAVER